MDLSIRTSDASSLRLVDGLVGLWLALWIALGGWAGYTLWQLSELGDTVSSSGQAIHSAGDALGSLGEVPVVGKKPLELGRQVSTAGVDITRRGQQVKGELRQLALLLGLAVAVMPTTPVLAFYLPQRLARRREVHEVRARLDRQDEDDSLDRYLALRALERLPRGHPGSFGDVPRPSMSATQTRALADAELAHLGLRR